MKSISVCLLLLVAGCATVPRPAPASADAPAAPAPVRELRRLALGRLPHLALRQVVLGTSIDLIVRGAAPGASGYVLCATSTSQAAWVSPASCGLATGTNYWGVVTGNLEPTTSAPQLLLLDEASSTTSAFSLLGWKVASFATGTAMNFRMGDGGGLNLWTVFGDKAMVTSYHGLVILASTGSTSQPTFSTGGGTGDYALEVSSGGSNGLKVDQATLLDGAVTVGAAGSSYTLQLKQTPAISFTATAQSCTDLTPGAVTGAALGCGCFMSPYNSTGGTVGNVSLTCGCTSAGHVGIHVCNPSTSSVTVSSKTFTYWLMQ